MIRFDNWKEKKILWFAVVIEIMIMIYFIIHMCGEREQISYTSTDYDVYAGEFRTDGCFFINEESGMEGDVCLSTKPQSLNKGIYRLELTFDGTSEQVCRIKNDGGGYHELLANSFSLHDNTKMSENGITFTLKEKADNLRIEIYYTGVGEFTLDEVYVIHTNQEYGIYLSIFLLFATVVNLWIHFKYQKRAGKDLDGQKIFFLLTVMAIIVSYPVFTDYVHWEDDFTFHFSRIEGIVQSWYDGQFPARMHPNWLNGLGYPLSIMYGDVFLWIPALLHLMGFDLMMSYKMGIIALNFVTVFISYGCFKQIFEDKWVAVFGTFLYSFSLYRLYNLYMRAAIGEATAMIFLPVVAYGLWLVFDEDREKVKEFKNILVLTAGFSGILLSHILSLEIVGLFTIVLCILLWKRTFWKETIWTLIKAAVLTIVLNSWFLVPFMDYVWKLPMNVFSKTELIQEKGIQLAQLFSIFQWAGVYNPAYAVGMQNARPIGMGVTFIVCVGTFVCLWYSDKKSLRRNKYFDLGRLSVILGGVASILCLGIFPWNALSKSNALFEKLISSIQFPYRFLVIATIMFSILACVVIKLLQDSKRQISANVWSGAIVIVALVTATFFMDDDLQNTDASGLRNAEALGGEQIGGAEYLLSETSVKELPYNTIICGENVSVSRCEKQYTHMEISCKNNEDERSYIEPNLLYYIGYEAYDAESGKRFDIVPGNGNIMRVILPAEYEGVIEIDFTGMWYWRIADVISLVVMIGVLIVIFRHCRKQRKANATECVNV